MSNESLRLLIKLPNCYITGNLAQITNRNDISLDIDEKDVFFTINHKIGIFQRKITFRGYHFTTHSPNKVCEWWHFRYGKQVIGDYIESVHNDWFVGFFTKTLNLRLCTRIESDNTPSYRL